jgi:hypothetical protein
MPTWVSKTGIWKPAKEKVNLTGQNGEPIQYEGEDRAAVEELKKAGQDHLGVDFREDVDVQVRAKEFGFKNAEEYAKARGGYDKEKYEKEYEEKAAKVNFHADAKKVKQGNFSGGGVNTAGQGHRYGGFGEQPNE